MQNSPMISIGPRLQEGPCNIEIFLRYSFGLGLGLGVYSVVGGLYDHNVTLLGLGLGVYSHLLLYLCILASNIVPPPRPLLCRRYKPLRPRLGRWVDQFIVAAPDSVRLG